MVELRLSCRNARQERSGASSSLAVQTPGLLELENCSWNAASAAGMRLQRLVLGQQLPSQLAAHSHTRTSASCICISSQLPAPRSILYSTLQDVTMVQYQYTKKRTSAFSKNSAKPQLLRFYFACL